MFGQGRYAEEWGISAPAEIDERFIQEAKKELLSAHGPEIQSALAKMSTGDVNETEVGMDELHKIIVKFTESKVGPSITPIAEKSHHSSAHRRTDARLGGISMLRW